MFYTSENDAQGMHVAGNNNRSNKRYAILSIKETGRSRRTTSDIISHWSSSSNRAKRRGADRDVGNLVYFEYCVLLCNVDRFCIFRETIVILCTRSPPRSIELRIIDCGLRTPGVTRENSDDRRVLLSVPVYHYCFYPVFFPRVSM